MLFKHVLLTGATLFCYQVGEETPLDRAWVNKCHRFFCFLARRVQSMASVDV